MLNACAVPAAASDDSSVANREKRLEIIAARMKWRDAALSALMALSGPDRCRASHDGYGWSGTSDSTARSVGDIDSGRRTPVLNWPKMAEEARSYAGRIWHKRS
jgi:hypothetical protein